YSEGDIHKPCTRPDFAIESHQFQVQIRRTQFIYSNQNFQNITGEWMLSKELKKFSEIAHIKRAKFIKAVLINKSSLGIWHPIPITRDEADFQQSETSLTKIEILTIINSLIPSLDDSDQLRF
ncbi:12280_t:CDS:1, partial [Funneliformis caledonium]